MKSCDSPSVTQQILRVIIFQLRTAKVGEKKKIDVLGMSMRKCVNIMGLLGTQLAVLLFELQQHCVQT